MNIVILLLVSNFLGLSFQSVFRGPCPKIVSRVERFDYHKLMSFYEVPFEIFTPNYLIFPFRSHESVKVYHSILDDILWVELRQSNCKTRPGIRFNNQTESLEVLLFSISNSYIGEKTEKDFICKIKINFQMAMIMIEDYGILWGCSEINGSVHDEALIIIASTQYFYTNPTQFKSKGPQLLENKSLLSESDIKNSVRDEFPVHLILANRSTHCDSFKCYSKGIQFIVIGVLLIKFIVLVTIYLIFNYCQ